MSYKTELEGYCGHPVKVTSWKNGVKLECNRRQKSSTEWRKPNILYNEVMAYCAHCPLCNVKGEEKQPNEVDGF